MRVEFSLVQNLTLDDIKYLLFPRFSSSDIDTTSRRRDTAGIVDVGDEIYRPTTRTKRISDIIHEHPTEKKQKLKTTRTKETHPSMRRCGRQQERYKRAHFRCALGHVVDLKPTVLLRIQNAPMHVIDRTRNENRLYLLSTPAISAAQTTSPVFGCVWEMEKQTFHAPSRLSTHLALASRSLPPKRYNPLGVHRRAGRSSRRLTSDRDGPNEDRRRLVGRTGPAGGGSVGDFSSRHRGSGSKESRRT